ncbi:MAG: NTP transferase domain-containing protein [Firmicutes bacterium]|nr:NTP transferase domain-containing protein [Bacillota bacterium]
MDYIVVQAGGKGTRLGYLTQNKPKALLPVENLPLIFHLIKKYPDKKFIVVGDYLKDVLREYLNVFADVKYIMVDAVGNGTCSGVKQALRMLPNNEPFMFIWSDLILPNEFSLPNDYLESNAENNYIGISETFPCRWSFSDNEIKEEVSTQNGIAGFFLFKNKSVISDVPESGEFVRYLKAKNIKFSTVGLAGTREFGLIEEYNKLQSEKCRPFNKITVKDNTLVKEYVDEQGKALAKKEVAWYNKIIEKDIAIIPKIYKTEPLTMEYIKGKNIYECDLSYIEKKEILKKIVDALKKLHNLEKINADYFSIKEAYFYKTMRRISSVRDLIPFSEQRKIVINGKECRNVYFYKRELEKKLDSLKSENFYFIHGDCTFSNIMLKDNGEPVLIDPRGYFGYTQFYGDERYDWAKLYYSIIGNYDRFNLKNFRLNITDENIQLKVKSNNWEDLEKDFFEMTSVNEYEIKLIHAIIWLSLTTYAWQDYDSICGAFYNGLYYLEDVL